jgi:hypothetical protein
VWRVLILAGLALDTITPDDRLANRCQFLHNMASDNGLSGVAAEEMALDVSMIICSYPAARFASLRGLESSGSAIVFRDDGAVALPSWHAQLVLPCDDHAVLGSRGAAGPASRAGDHGGI